MMIASVFAAAVATANVASAELPPWRDPAVNSINRLPARNLLVPCETEELAIDIAQGYEKKAKSRWVQSLNGTWDFKWKPNPTNDWQKSATITVPSCWQLQGEYDPALYTNTPYPIGFDGTGDPMIDPPKKDYTSYSMRNPVGLYTTTFKRPWRWWFRRTVIRFHGVSSAFYVRVNGKFVGYAEDSRLPSEFDLTPYLNVFGKNTLEVEVYKHCDGTYLEDQDFWRLSGIFRDVMLVSEHKKAPKDMVVETWLSDDYSAGKFWLRDENGNEIKMRDVPNPKLWSAEYPYVYVTPVEHKWGWWIFGGTDHYTVSFGFRKVEIKDSVIYLNGKRVLFKGANRHEMEPSTGYTVTEAGMNRDIDIFKEFNMNAVRTCHYPDAPEWYEKTDRAGLMVVCEANVEAHGVPSYYAAKGLHLPKNPRFHDMIVERNTRMVQFYRNHPSIVIWSLGNESGDGPAMADAYKAVKAIDATRPVQYEAAQDTDHSDLKCPMYSRPWDCEKYVANKPAKPMVLCEYTHAMGNSNGDVHDYWRLAKKYPSFQGGFVWDFQDQAIWKTDAKGKWLAYGGDFGDKPNDDNFNCNGLFDALRNPHPGAFELKHAYQPIHVTAYDWTTGESTVESDLLFTPMDEFDQEVTYTRNGRPVEKKEEADAVLFRFYRDGDLVAWDQFTRPFEPKAVPSCVPADGAGQPLGDAAGETHRGTFKLNFWRAPTDNDRGWQMPNVCKVWKDATASQKLPEGVTSDLKVSKTTEGATLVDWTLVVPKGLPPIPRVGLTFTVPKTEKTVEWYGLGPWENYSDRCEGAILGIHRAMVGLVKGIADEKTGTIAYPANRLNPDNYIEPGEQGYRSGVRSLKIGAVEVEAVNAPFGFNAWPYPQTMLEGKKHSWELAETDEITLNVDAAQMGVGGDDSWGARPHNNVMLGAGTYRLVFTVKGL